ncbi:hypothetical protein H0H92_003656 [Tricholoma furcatifolium]|nr:hypothetical protein H0H92_003656 [Tricholoma furcatifolium]
MNWSSRNAVKATPMGQRSTSLNPYYQAVSAKTFSPSDEVFQSPAITHSASLPPNVGSKALTYGNWKPSGYTTASSQASRLATKNAPARRAISHQPYSMASAATRVAPGPSRITESTAVPSTSKPPPPPAPSPTDTSLQKVREAQIAFETLRSDFLFPEDLEFSDKPLQSDSSPLGHLTFNKTNRPVREYKEALIRLQTDLDAIPSHNDVSIRASRKDVIDKVDHALWLLEEEVEKHLQEWRKSRREANHVSETTKIPIPDAHPKTFKGGGPPRPPSFPTVPSMPGPDILRLLGDNPVFHREYTKAVNEAAEIQIQRFRAISQGRSTNEFEDDLFALDREWKDRVHRLILVVCNGVEQWAGSDSSSSSDGDFPRTNYLRLALDPLPNDSLPARF